jgi:hypothetical protein
LRLAFASVPFAIVEVLLAVEATGASDYSTGLARLVLVARVFAKQLGSLLMTTSVNISPMGDERQKGAITWKLFLTPLVSSCQSFPMTLTIYAVNKGKIGKI